MTEEDIRRGQRWKAFYEEEGGLRDIMETIADAYIERMSSLEPWETEKLSKLAMANKIVKQIDVFALDIIANGKVAEAARDHINRIQKIPARKRRLLGFGDL